MCLVNRRTLPIKVYKLLNVFLILFLFVIIVWSFSCGFPGGEKKLCKVGLLHALLCQAEDMARLALVISVVWQ